MVWRMVVGAAVGLVVVLVSIGLVGRWVWHAKSEELLTELTASAHEIRPPEFRLSQLDKSPVPVREYLSQVLSAGPRAVESVRISHSGTFNMGTGDPQWRPFSSTQDVVVTGPGFLWNAHIRMAPGMSARVHDAYVNGRAVLSARLFGLITVMEAPDSPELAQGELLRFLAEAPWYPTALLPGPNVAWESIDEDTARLTLVDGNTSVSLAVRFGADGLIDSVYSDGRYRDVDGVQIKTPWEGRFWNYQERDGMLIPLDGEVAWLLPEGRRPYWRGHLDEITYEFADVTGASTAAVTLCAGYNHVTLNATQTVTLFLGIGLVMIYRLGWRHTHRSQRGGTAVPTLYGDETALLVVDVQHALPQRASLVYNANHLLQRRNILTDPAHQAESPVMSFQHINKGVLEKNSKGWMLHPHLNFLDVDTSMEKRRGSAFQARLSQQGAVVAQPKTISFQPQRSPMVEEIPSIQTLPADSVRRSL